LSLEARIWGQSITTSDEVWFGCRFGSPFRSEFAGYFPVLQTDSSNGQVYWCPDLFKCWLGNPWRTRQGFFIELASYRRHQQTRRKAADEARSLIEGPEKGPVVGSIIGPVIGSIIGSIIGPVIMPVIGSIIIMSSIIIGFFDVRGGRQTLDRCSARGQRGGACRAGGNADQNEQQ
jgi:hypothetical protein